MKQPVLGAMFKVLILTYQRFSKCKLIDANQADPNTQSKEAKQPNVIYAYQLQF